MHNPDTSPLSVGSRFRIGEFPTSSITAIIPAYNEARGIGRVLAVLRQVTYLREIIVVNDGSDDATELEAHQAAGLDPRIRIINHPVNLGKGEAVYTGWSISQSNIILTLDADLIGLTPQHVLDLIQPVVACRADMSLGLFSGGRWNTDLSHRMTPWLTGQRCFRTEVLRYVSHKAAQGYGFETALTLTAKRQGYRLVRVKIVGVSHPPSESHRGFWKGLRNRTRMYTHIIRAWYHSTGWHRFFGQLKDWTWL